ncbi:triphosphoribosyl-dephospho-CoA synthase MdcB [Herminiimonas sp. NPDC097707]|uniref:triphosphoribosyl-dephospho-CoA synthase MdcB n=1 Tax=Herminiimonas sp. NPDC097707 TaxID=3364007 RepID=UPI00383A5695
MKQSAHSFPARSREIPGSVAVRMPSANKLLRDACLATAGIAIGSLHAELVLYPKPGLVSLIDNGSHTDMDAGLFMRSLFSLRHYFVRAAHAGAADVPFGVLKELGIQAEQRMLAATGGINTHRGAIFSLGLLCAAAGYCHSHGLPLSESTLRTVLMRQWGAALEAHSMPPASGTSHGMRVAHLYGISGAREEGAKGFPAVFDIGVPQLRKTIAAGRSSYHAQIDALFALMAHMADTNIYHRGGPDGAVLARQAAQGYIALGGTAHPHWHDTALDSHRQFVSRGLSPGGAADMLAASWFVYQASLWME